MHSYALLGIALRTKTMSLLDRKIVLVLNANWQPIRSVGVQDAFTKMSRISKGKYAKKQPYCALDIDYPRTESGGLDYDTPLDIRPVFWPEWINLPVREFDRFANTAKTKIRIPTVIIANNYKAIPKKKLKYSKTGVWKRDQFVCQLTQKPLTYKTGSIDHWLPSSRGGKSAYDNCILVSKDVNFKKGDYTMEEFCSRYGFQLPQKPQTPPAEALFIENTYQIPDWEIFLK